MSQWGVILSAIVWSGLFYAGCWLDDRRGTDLWGYTALLFGVLPAFAVAAIV